MQAHEREAIYAAGGVWYTDLKYAFRKYADSCDAFFGHCGDKRALEVALAAGFIKTEYAPVIVNWHKPLPEVFRRALGGQGHRARGVLVRFAWSREVRPCMAALLVKKSASAVSGC